MHGDMYVDGRKVASSFGCWLGFVLVLCDRDVDGGPFPA